MFWSSRSALRYSQVVFLSLLALGFEGCTKDQMVEVIPAPDLGVGKEHAVPFFPGESAQYDFVVFNRGMAETSGATTVTDTLPPGLTFDTGSGSGWTFAVDGQVVTATHTGVLAPNDTTGFSVTVSLDSMIGSSVTNVAYVRTPDDDNSANNRSSVTTTVGPQSLNGKVRALGVYDGKLVAGGEFTFPAHYLAYWTGTRWQAFDEQPNGPVSALTVFQGDLWIGGDFTHVGTQEMNHVAHWDGTSWTALGSGVNGPVYALLGDRDIFLYAGGNFTEAGGVEAHSVALYVPFPPTRWEALGDGLEGDVRTLAYHNGSVHAAGEFSVRNTPEVQERLVRWDGENWTQLAPRGINDEVLAMVVFENSITVGGSFDRAEFATPVGHIATLAGNSWRGFNLGFATAVADSLGPADVLALTPENGTLVAGGTFDRADRQEANHIASWTGTNWSTIGSGTNDDVRALTYFEGNLIAGGDFTQAGGMAAPYVAGYDGANWYPIPDLSQ